jgi:hypothetical protein
MNTADYALIVSICSAAIALFGLAWNVWSKFIYPKAKLRLRFYVAVIVGGDGDPKNLPKYLTLNVTNHGPTDVAIQSVGLTIKPRFWSKPKHGLVNPIHTLADPTIGIGPFGGGLPKKLPVGETHSIYFPFNAQSFGREALGRFGVYDNFGRFHRASRRELRLVRQSLDAEFGPKLAPEPWARSDRVDA